MIKKSLWRAVLFNAVCVVAYMHPLFTQAEPIAQWPLEVDGVEADDKGAEHPAQIKGSPLTVKGVVGNAFLFDGSEDYLSTDADEALDFSKNATFSISVWVNAYELRTRGALIIGKNVYAANQREWGLLLDDDQQFRFYLRDPVSRKWGTVSSGLQPKAGHWNHVVVTLNHGMTSLYINGILQDSKQLSRSFQATSAPLTIGAINNRGAVFQAFHGAIDEVALYDRVLSLSEITNLGNYQPESHDVSVFSKPNDYTLWTGASILNANELPQLSGVDFHVIKPYEYEKDGYRFLHGVALAWHHEKLYSFFGHNKWAENTGGEEARGRVSEDGGRTWGEIFTIDSGDREGSAVSHGVFLSHEDTLWAFCGAFGKDVFKSKTYTLAYVLNESNDSWESRGVVVRDGFWPMQEPIRMDDGNWIMSGMRVGGGNPAAVAISHGDDLTQWDLVVIPLDYDGMWGESTVIVSGSRIINIARRNKDLHAYVATSDDFGRSWTHSTPSNLPMTRSKSYAGVLSTGHRYLIGTTAADVTRHRAPLTIAVSRPGEDTFCSLYVIRHALFDQGPGESDSNAALSYPYAIEHEGRLYVGYSNDGGKKGRTGSGRERLNNNSAELAIIPLESLIGSAGEPVLSHD